MHASDAAALFFAADEDEGVEDDDSMYEGGGDEQDEWDSRGGSPVDEGDQDTDTISVRYLPILRKKSTNTALLLVECDPTRQWHGSSQGCGKADLHPDL